MQKRLGMKKLGLFFILLALVSCSKKKEQPIRLPQPMEIKTIMDSIDFDKDSLIFIDDIENEYRVSLSKFLKMKDTLIYVWHEHEWPYWCTRRAYRWYYCYPDTISVKSGKYTITADRVGVAYDKKGNAYSPAYVYYCPVSGTLTWDVYGKFLGENLD